MFADKPTLRNVFSAFLVTVLLISALSGVAFAATEAKGSGSLSSPVALKSNLPGEVGYSVFQLSDGSLVLNTSNQTCTFLVKLDTSNHLLWMQTIRIGQDVTNLTRLLPTSDGGFLLAGLVNNACTLVKTDSRGNIQWTQMFTSGAKVNYFMAIIQTHDGGFAAADFGENAVESLGWIWFFKTDSLGNMEWNETLQGKVADCPSSLIQTSDGGYILSCTPYSFVPNQGFFSLTKMNAAGNVVWNTTYGGEGYFIQPECNGAIATQDGGYLMFGYLWDKCAWIVKTDAAGIMKWNQTYGAKGSSITGAVETSNGGYLLLTISNLTLPGLMMTDQAGKELWTMSLPGVTLPWGLEANYNSIISVKGGGYVMVGSENNTVWLAKLNLQDNGSITLQLLSIPVAVLTLAATALLPVALKKTGRKNSSNLSQQHMFDTIDCYFANAYDCFNSSIA
ncbi:MAG TPA: hypothetical protein VLV84_02170 [Candidatus Acidoferrales bacterium]|nr:hypothetical protein [Candidatus Acidoferrales bacterium]